MAGGFEWIVILIIVIVLFGGGRIAKLGGELGTAVREFRRGLTDGKKEAADEAAAKAPEAK